MRDRPNTGITREVLDQVRKCVATGSAEDLSAEEMDKLLAEQARVQGAIDACNGWVIDRTLEIAMDALIPVTIVLLSGGSRNAEVPAEVAVKELIPELTTSLELPVTGPDGRPMSHRLDSKALGRELKEEETLSQAGIPEGDRLMMTADVTAG